MRTLLTVVLILLVMSVAGWLVFSYNGGTAKVELRTDAVKRDVDNAVQNTEKFIKGIGDDTAPTSPPSDVLQTPSPR